MKFFSIPTLLRQLVCSFVLIFSLITHAVYNGEKVDPGQPIAKSSVAIHIKMLSGYNDYCSAVVLKQDVIMTSAHCLDLTGVSEISVRPGTTVQKKGSAEPTGPKIDISDKFIPEKYLKISDQNYLEKGRVDIAIIKLKTPLPKEYEPATLELDKQSYNTQIKLSGYGVQKSSGARRNITEPSAATENVELRSVAAKVDQADLEVLKIDQTAGGVCFGDSGGGIYDPIALNENKSVVVAINAKAGASKNKKNCDDVAFGIRLIAHKKWIQETLDKIDSSRATASAPANTPHDSTRAASAP